MLRNVWYVAAWSHEVTARNILPRKLLGEDVVIFRKADGSIAAMSDYCPHRYAPLSLGRNEGDGIRCMYHGLKFGAAGTCIDSPAGGKLATRLKAQVHPVVEKNRFIWIWMGDAGQAHASDIPTLPQMDDDQWCYVPRHLKYAANYKLLMDNLLDASHLAFVHAQTLGGGTYHAETLPLVETFDWGVRLTRKYASIPIPPFVQNVARFKGLADRWQVFSWRIAGNQLVIESGQAPAGTGALHGHFVEEAFHFNSVQTMTPESDSSTHYFFMFANNFAVGKDAVAAEIDRQFTAVLEEDRVMLEGQQKVLDSRPQARLGALEADLGVSKARAMLDRMLHAEALSKGATSE